MAILMTEKTMENANETIKKLTETFKKIIPETDKRMLITPLVYIVSLVFKFLGDSKSSSGLYQNLLNVSQQHMSRGSFWERLAGDRLRKTMENLVAALMVSSIGAALTTSQILKQLKVIGIFLLDSTTVALPKSAKKDFPGTKNAAAKVHSLFNLFSGNIEWFKISAGKEHDSNYFPPFELLTGALIIFDLGYFEYQLMVDLIAANVYFLCRLKTNSVVFIEKVVIGLTPDSVGKSLLSVVNSDKFQGHVLEAIVKILTKDKNTLQCRAIGFWNPNDKCYHWYLCNLLVAARLIYPLYRLRWQIELIFKACKDSLNINSIHSANPNIIKTLLLASLAAHLSSQTIHEIALEALTPDQYLAISFRRIAKVFVTLRDKFQDCILNTTEESIDTLVQSILHLKNELYDPNYRTRRTSKSKIYDILLETSAECT